jgi:nucleoid DNA-binding protein
MTKAELIERVHAKKHLPRNLTKKAVGQIVDAVFLEMGDYFIRTKVTRNATAKLTYPGFGTFLKRRRGERTVKNPQNGDPIVIPPQSTITFSPGQELRALLNRNGKNGAKDTHRHDDVHAHAVNLPERNGQPMLAAAIPLTAKASPKLAPK